MERVGAIGASEKDEYGIVWVRGVDDEVVGVPRSRPDFYLPANIPWSNYAEVGVPKEVVFFGDSHLAQTPFDVELPVVLIAGSVPRSSLALNVLGLAHYSCDRALHYLCWG